MDIEQFKDKLELASSEFDEEYIENVIARSIDSCADLNPRGHKNLIIVMEELSELSQAVSKELRGKTDKYNLIEELADVSFCLYYLMDICHISKETLVKAINVKAKRLEEMLDNNSFA